MSVILNLIVHFGTSKVSSVLIIFDLLLFFYLLFHNTKSYNLPPGPIGLLILGYLPFLDKLQHQTLFKLSQKYGNVFSFYLGQNLTVVCNDWTSTEEALGKMETSNRPLHLFDSLPDKLGFVALNGKDWIATRRLVVKIMRDIGLGQTKWEEQLQEEVGDIIDVIRRSDGKPLKVEEVLSTTFTTNIMTLASGSRLPAFDPINVRFNQGVKYLPMQLKAICYSNYFPGLCNFLNKLGLYTSKESLQEIFKLNKTIRKFTNEKIENEDTDTKSFIGLFHNEIEKNNTNPDTVITKNLLYGTIQAFLLGGVQSVKTAMEWLLLAMAENQGVQKKIQEELDTALGNDEKLMWSTRNDTPYTYCSILESLRWNTLLPVNPIRLTNEDIKIQNYDIPKGTFININMWALHSDPKYWSEPKKFKPERFMKDGKINNSPEGFIAFSCGRRNCPGKLIALMELYQYFVTIIQNFTILPPEDGIIKYKSQYGMLFEPIGLKLRFISRDNRN